MTDPHRQDIADLLARYGQLLDRRDTAAWLALFTDDAVVTVEGSRAPLATHDARRRLAEHCPRGVHVANHPVLAIDGGTASSTQTFLYWNLDTASALGGWYDDQLRRDPAGWRFVRRDIHFFAPTAGTP